MPACCPVWRRRTRRALRPEPPGRSAQLALEQPAFIEDKNQVLASMVRQFDRGRADTWGLADCHARARRGPRPDVRGLRRAARPTACTHRGLRRVGRRRASCMGSGPDGQHRVCRHGRPQGDDRRGGRRGCAGWRGPAAWDFPEPGRGHRQAGGTAGRGWAGAELLLRGRPVRLRPAAAAQGAWSRLHGGGAVPDPEHAGRPGEDRPA